MAAAGDSYVAGRDEIELVQSAVKNVLSMDPDPKVRRIGDRIKGK
jgi:hypothetical protein